jgi:hypothetical protein
MELFLCLFILLAATDMKLYGFFATVIHINPVFTGLIKDYPTALFG